MRDVLATALGVFLGLAVAGCSADRESQSTPVGEVAAPHRSPERSPQLETWDALFIGGAHVGRVHTTQTAVRDGERQLVKTVSDTRLRLARFGDTAEMRVRTESLDTPDGAVHRFAHTTESGGSPIVVQGRVDDQELILTTITAGTETTTRMPWESSHGGFSAVEQSLRRAPLQPGQERTITLLMPGLTGVQWATATLAAQEHEPTQLLEGTVVLLRIEQQIRAEGLSLEGFSWMDAHGELLKSSVPALQQETFRTTRERAEDYGGDSSFDIGRDTVVRLASPLPRAHATRQVVYEASLPRKQPADVFVAGTSQRVEPLDEHTARITVRAVRPGDPADVVSEAPPSEADRRANNLIQTEDPLVRRLAAAIAPDVTNPWELAQALEAWVHGAMTKKNFSQGFATAADVAQSLTGDCTEHAVLLAALCRARDIPARVCIGLVYSATDQGFAFHMWNEAWIVDRWVPLDATLGLGGIGAAHLKLRHSSLASDQVESVMLSVLEVMHQLQLRILEAQ